MFSSLEWDTYYIFECKRFNKKLIDNYVKEGIARFVKGQYYSESDNYLAGMISFLEAVKIKDRINNDLSFDMINTVLLKYRDEIRLNGNLNRYRLICSESQYVEDYEYVFLSSHGREKNPHPIYIFHIVLDYNQLILD